MVLSVKCQLEDDDFNSTSQHETNTILVAFEGPGAARTPLHQLKEFLVQVSGKENVPLSISQLSHHYRFEEPCKVYFPLPQGVVPLSLHGKALTNNGVTYRKRAEEDFH